MDLVIPQEIVDSQLASCKDGEMVTFTAALKRVPGVGAIATGDTVTKAGGYREETDEGEEPLPSKPKMSAAAAAVVGRKGAIGVKAY